MFSWEPTRYLGYSSELVSSIVNAVTSSVMKCISSAAAAAAVVIFIANVRLPLMTIVRTCNKRRKGERG